MRNHERLYTIQEVASLTRRSVGITRVYAAKLGLGKRVPNRGRNFCYTYDDAAKILLYKTNILKSTKKKVVTKKAAKRKVVIARQRKPNMVP